MNFRSLLDYLSDESAPVNQQTQQGKLVNFFAFKKVRLSTVEIVKHKQKRERMQRSILTNIHHRSRMIEPVPGNTGRENQI